MAVKEIYIFYVLLCLPYLPLISGNDIPQELIDAAKEIHNQCQNKIGISNELIAQARTGALPSEPNFKCYIHCLMVTANLMDANNNVHLENFLEIFPPHLHAIVQNLATKCGTKSGADACDTAYKTALCYFEVDLDSMTKTLSFLI